MTTVPEVVAGLVDDGNAGRLAQVAIDRAVSLGVGVRFVQVRRADTPVSGYAGDATFAAATRALRGHPGLRCTFEVAIGDAAAVLVQRSRRASLLVVGEDRRDDAGLPVAGADVAHYCVRNAACPVMQVAPG